MSSRGVGPKQEGLDPSKKGGTQATGLDPDPSSRDECGTPKSKAAKQSTVRSVQLLIDPSICDMLQSPTSV